MKNLFSVDYLKTVLSDHISRYKRSGYGPTKNRVAKSQEWQELLTTGRDVYVPEKRHLSSWRIVFFQLTFIGIFFVLLSRLFSLQLLSGSKFLSASLSNQLRVQITRATRGVMYDRNGTILASSTPGFRIAIDTQNLSSSDIDQSLRKLSTILHVDESELRKNYNDNSHLSSITLAREVNRDNALNVEAQSKELPGVVVEVSPVRFYQDSSVFAHVVGYTGEVSEEELARLEFAKYNPGDRSGKSGLEALLESRLHGKDGKELISVDADGKKSSLFGVVPASNGESVTVSIDAGLQKVLYDSLDKTMKEVKSPGAAAVALDPGTGEVLALVSLPSYDNNLFARGIKEKEYRDLISNQNRPLLNRALSGTYPPASTFKIINASAGLAEHIIDRNTTYEAPSSIDLGGGAIFRDWKDHGVINVVRAIAESSDTFFYKLGGGLGSLQGLGADRLAKWSRLFGFGSPTEIGLINEASGLIPDPAWKKERTGEDWYLGNTYNMSIGQGDVLVTPLQLANATSCIANNGILFKPSMIKGAKSGILRQNFIAPSVLEVVREGMKQATLPGGTAYPLRDFKIQTAGKTGTGEATGKETKPYAWYTSFAPFDKPSIVITVMIEDAGQGSDVASPIAKKGFEYWFRDQLKK